MKISYMSTSPIINHPQINAFALTGSSTWKMFRFDGDTVSYVSKTLKSSLSVVLLLQSLHCCIWEQSVMYCITLRRKIIFQNNTFQYWKQRYYYKTNVGFIISRCNVIIMIMQMIFFQNITINIVWSVTTWLTLM